MVMELTPSKLRLKVTNDLFWGIQMQYDALVGDVFNRAWSHLYHGGIYVNYAFMQLLPTTLPNTYHIR